MNPKKIIVVLLALIALSYFFNGGMDNPYAICDTLGDDWGPNCIYPNDNHIIRNGN